MFTLNDWSLKFVRWGMGLAVVGLVTGYLPLGHYLMKDSLPSCPAAPVHGHTILLSFIGMSLFGLLYRALPSWNARSEPPLHLVRLHFQLVVTGILGVAVNGTIGYELLAMLSPDFYYAGAQAQTIRNLWFAIDGVFLTVYGGGCAVFLVVLMKTTRYSTEDLTLSARAGDPTGRASRSSE